MSAIGVAFVRHVLLDRIASCFWVRERSACENGQPLATASRPQLEDGISAIDKPASAVVHTVADNARDEHSLVEPLRDDDPHPSGSLDDLLLGAWAPLSSRSR